MNFHDSEIASLLISLDEKNILPDVSLLELLKTIQDDNTYWQIVSTVWIKWGRRSEVETWRELLAAPRRGRWHLMKKQDRRVWRSLPNTVRAYRATAPEEDNFEAIAWTLDKEVCRRIYGASRPIIEGRFFKTQIIAYLDRRGEKEILVL